MAIWGKWAAATALSLVVFIVALAACSGDADTMVLAPNGMDASDASAMTTGDAAADAKGNVGGTAAPVGFAPAAGVYASSITVSLFSATPDAVIYYTRDGSDPTESSLRYDASTAVPLSTSTTLKAIAVHAGLAPSPVTSAVYAFLPPPPEVAPVTFNPPSRNIPAAGLDVSLATTTAGATIHYTLDGTDPTATSPVFVDGAPIKLSPSAAVPIKAFAAKDGYTNSPVTLAVYGVDPPTSVDPPIFSPVAGTYASTVSLVITSTTPNAVIYFTLDGSDPTTASSPYSNPLTISTTTTVKAIATLTGLPNSTVSTATYTIKPTVADVTFAPPEGTYSNPLSVTLSTTTPGATIFYTLDGSTPTSNSVVYSTPIAITATTTVRAFAAHAGMTSSAITQAVYTFPPPSQTVALVSFAPPGGTFNNPVAVGMSTTTSGATIYYTVDGSKPTVQLGAQYVPGSPVAIDAPTGGGPLTLKAFAKKSGFNDSSVTTELYSFKVADVQFSPAPGPTPMPGAITLTTNTASSPTALVKIYYTLNGSTPTTSSTLYTAPINLAADTTIRAIAVKPNYASSEVVTGVYTAQ